MFHLHLHYFFDYSLIFSQKRQISSVSKESISMTIQNYSIFET